MATLDTPTPKRSVSFGPNSGPAPPSFASGSGTAPATPAGAGASASSSAAASPGAALKPALKATAHLPLPPAAQYAHADPLLRRLRLVDAAGAPVDLRAHFRDAKVVAFYFSSQWAGQPLREYTQTITEFCRAHPHEFKVVYVSVDVDERWYKAGVQGKPWVSMAWNDGSSLPGQERDDGRSGTGVSSADDDAPPALYNNEDFLLAGEADIDEFLSRSDTTGTAYLRPFSRVHLASKLNILAAPTLAVYYPKESRFLDWNVRIARLKDGEREETWRRWSNGEGAGSFGVRDFFKQAPGTTALLVIAMLMWAAVLFGGDDYNFVKFAIEQAQPLLGWKGDPAAVPHAEL